MPSDTPSIPLDLVVARYCEPVGWINDLKAAAPRVWLYNKGGESTKRPALPLDNIGREAHTYLHHIVRHWHELAERTVFCQGNPHDHAEQFVDDVLLYAINPNAKDFTWFGRNVRNQGVRLVRDDLTGAPHHGARLDIADYAKRFNINLPEPYVHFAPGACFGVTRRMIRSRPKGFYEALLADITDRPGRSQPWILERLWGYIFVGMNIVDTNAGPGRICVDN